MYSLMNNKLLHHHHLHPQFSPLPLSLHSIPRTSLSSFELSFPQNALSTSAASLYSQKPRNLRVFSKAVPLSWGHEKDKIFDNNSTQIDDLAPDSPVYQNTLRLVECSMFAAVAGLAYLLSNTLAIENYFGCFFALPIVISSMRWGIPAGRKTMVATAVLLLVLSGPVKALTYVLMHGLLGLTMGSLWRMQVRWSLSVFLCTLVRALGAVGYVLTSSFLIRENILALITINVHATITLIFNSLGFYTVPSMNLIYAIFCTLLLLNCSVFVLLLHILYALFLTRLGMKASLKLPRWLQKAL